MALVNLLGFTLLSHDRPRGEYKVVKFQDPVIYISEER